MKTEDDPEMKPESQLVLDREEHHFENRHANFTAQDLGNKDSRMKYYDALGGSDPCIRKLFKKQ